MVKIHICSSWTPEHDLLLFNIMDLFGSMGRAIIFGQAMHDNVLYASLLLSFEYCIIFKWNLYHAISRWSWPWSVLWYMIYNTK